MSDSGNGLKRTRTSVEPIDYFAYVVCVSEGMNPRAFSPTLFFPLAHRSRL
jgi:hypothetical protein